MGKLSAQVQEKVEAIADIVLSHPIQERDQLCWGIVELLVGRLSAATGEGDAAPRPAATEGRTKLLGEPGTFGMLPPTFLEDGKAEVSLQDYCDEIVLSKKYDKLLAVVAYLQEELKLFPVTISEIMTSLRYLRWSAKPDPAKQLNAIYAINSEHKGRFFVNIESGWNVVLSPDGLTYVKALPRRKRRGGSR